MTTRPVKTGRVLLFDDFICIIKLLHIKQGDMMAFGKYLIYASGILLFIFFVLQYFLGVKIAAYLQSKDTFVTGRIIGNKFGAVYFCCLSSPFWGIAIGNSILNAPSMLFAMFAFSLMIGAFAYLKYKTELTIDADGITIKELIHTKKFPMSDISSVSFEQSGIPYNRCLVITLRNGMRLTYAQEDYWGLSWFYEQLQEKLSDKSDSLY